MWGGGFMQLINAPSHVWSPCGPSECSARRPPPHPCPVGSPALAVRCVPCEVHSGGGPSPRGVRANTDLSRDDFRLNRRRNNYARVLQAYADEEAEKVCGLPVRIRARWRRRG